MTISVAASPSSIAKPNGQAAFVDIQTGALSAHGLQLLNEWRNYILGMNRITPCNAVTVSNVITLTPLTASPLIESYKDYEVYSFVADASTTGSVTMTVAPRSGTLATLKAFKTNGSAQAGNGDVVAGSHYLAIYVDSLDTAVGGFVLK